MLKVVRGASEKTAYTEKLIDLLEKNDIEGIFYSGYPIIGSLVDKIKIDGMLLSPDYGVVIFNINQGSMFEDKVELHDLIYNNLEARLKKYPELSKRRKLQVLINILEFAPAWNDKIVNQDLDFDVCNEKNLIKKLDEFKWSSPEYYDKLVESIQLISQLKKRGKRNYVKNEKSKGGKLKLIEDEISSLDHCQNQGVIETVNGVQRIRGLAGSGKTIVLALKVAYLYSMYDDKVIAVTFNTRSLKNQFKNLIANFIIENTSEEPDWERIKIIHAWGSPKSSGIYYEFCMKNNIEYLDYSGAKAKFGNRTEDLFGAVCKKALESAKKIEPMYDMILVDEAQDFSKYFLRMCYSVLPENSRMLVYAYDELQSLNNNNVEAPEKLFGFKDGKPLVSLKNEDKKPQEDIILNKCYRNSKPVLTTAHSLGFGIYREGLVQIFEDKKLWYDIGYRVIEGEIEDNKEVTLSRTPETSPEFLENHSEIDDLIIFKKFETIEEEANWISDEVVKNLEKDELAYNDIVIIHPNPLTTRKYVSEIRKNLFNRNIVTHIAGVDISPDEFNSEKSITISQIYRAKGNEAAMVYLVNADYCYSGINLAQKRNILFTAITRSKGWVRVTGIGEKMDGLIEEYKKVKDENFRLKFIYPDEKMRARLRIIHRDKTKSEQDEIKNTENALVKSIERIKQGKIQKEDLSKDILEELAKLLSDDN
ncbi:DEAD/DEAH box helicase [Clostridium perfringens]|uniref:DEAD/DEAH box helicase n=1 Tax=Clostridium perfringens TaxID=1502 RepID=UPI001241157B|nr:ATP-binding domain-containing protein [Clostridium perfringens]EGT4141235.1 hypothetical protein [Clostridium perfringens]UYX11370.1 ATP-binding domain-containing protein [Clostridium perfringens]HAT4164804.1 ATP-binding domain-containing protein [Clostridium perfringens]HAT4266246.1 ATP-binding domain-containing protein [Clostridium perfringens]HAT4274370.1 ATP-binding domain-containing protein [Clostridium perfringens]